ncbi:MAG: flagellar export chaperone FliS [Burkholderiaceae bacterium]|jgi:flagellar protein FliS|nr:Flagellar secretion chaperone FliS [Cupriavidus sp.]
MRPMKRGIDSYGDVKVSTGVATADSVQLIQMLFDGLIESLRAAEGQIARGAIEEKSRSLARAGKIVLGLQSALNFESGGEIARNLDELYGYVTRRLLHVNLHNDLEALKEVYGLMAEIQSAWSTVPSMLEGRRSESGMRLAS